MLKRKVAVLLLVINAGIISCRKDTADLPATPGPGSLMINFQNSLLSINDIDSGNVVFRRQGSNTPVFQRLVKGASSMETTIDGFATGDWTAELELYTKKQTDGKSYQYTIVKAFSITTTTNTLSVHGPSQAGIDIWKKRLVMSTNDNDIIVILPMDVMDPYFEIRTKGFQWNFFSVERTAVSGTAIVANQNWVCNNDCPGDDRLIYNSDAFIPFTEAIRVSSWTRNEITVTVGNIQQQQYNDFTYQW